MINKAVYGILQSEKYFYEEMKSYLKYEMVYSVSRDEPCLFMNPKSHVIIGLYVDDLLITGTENYVYEDIEKLKQKYSIIIKSIVDEYVGF